jgi:HemY protein
MLKVILFLLAAAVVVAAGWALAGIPGHVVASIGAFSIETSTPVAILTLVVLVVLVVLFLRILRGVVAIPRTGAGWRRRHRLSLGERSVTRVLVALAAGEQGAARKEARRARFLLGDSPQTLLLVAEAGRMSGREDEAEEDFGACFVKRWIAVTGPRRWSSRSKLNQPIRVRYGSASSAPN